MVEKKEEEEQPKKKLGDKIFGAHNNPIKDFDYSDNFEVDQNHKFVETCYDEQEYLHKKKLEEANKYTFILPVCKLEFAKKVKNPYEKGEILQKLLQTHKIALNTSFYRVSLDEIKLLFDLADGEMINYNSDL